MISHRILSVMVILLLTPITAVSDDTAELQALRDKIAKLEQSVAQLSADNAKLQAENHELKSPDSRIFGKAQSVVVSTIPMAGDDSVDPALTEIKVRFSKDMMDKSWSWATAYDQDAYPTTEGSPRYLEDGRTCVLPVKLDPGKTYAMWLNSEKFGNFRDKDGQSSVPYLLVFKTKE